MLYAAIGGHNLALRAEVGVVYLVRHKSSGRFQLRVTKHYLGPAGYKRRSLVRSTHER